MDKKLRTLTKKETFSRSQWNLAKSWLDNRVAETEPNRIIGGQSVWNENTITMTFFYTGLV